GRRVVFMGVAMNAEQWSQIVAKAWADASFKQRLLSDPHAVLKEHGIEVPGGLQVRVMENTDSVRHVILPTKHSTDELSEDALSAVAGAGWRQITNKSV